jgi:hypothetical protein
LLERNVAVSKWRGKRRSAGLGDVRVKLENEEFNRGTGRGVSRLLGLE